MADVGIRITAVDDTRQAFGSINAGLGSIKTAAASVSTSLAAVGIGLSAGAFVAFAKNVINSVDALNDLKDATGASIENISALQDIASRTGTSLDTVGTSLVKMNQVLNSAKPGSEVANTIERIGLSVKDLKALDPAEAFRQLAVGLNKFSDDGDKARASQELFGKSLKEVAPLLKDVAEQGSLVATVTTEQAEAAEKLNKQFFNMQTNIGNAGRSLVNDLVPTLSVVAEEFSKSMTAADGFGKLLGDGIKVAIETTSILIANVSFVLKGMGRQLGAVAAQLVALGTLDIKGFNAISEAVKEDGIRARKELEDLERRILMPSLADSSAGGGRGVGYGKFKIDRPSLGGGNSVDTAAVASANRELAEQAKLIAELNGLSGSFQEDWARLSTLFKNGKLNLQDLTAAQAALLAKQPAVKAETDAQTEAQKAATKALEDDLKARERYNDTFEKSADGVAKQLQALQDEEQALAIAAAANITLAEAIAQVEIARLREQQAIQLSYGNDTAAAAIQREIDLRKQLAKAINSKDARDAAKKFDEDNIKSAERFAEQLENQITDGLMRGFENGKGIAENFADTLENVFNTLILRPLIQGVVSGVTGQGGGGFGQAISTVQSAYNTGSALLQKGGTADLVGDKLYDFGDALSKTGSGPLANFGSDLAANSSKIGKKFEQLGDAMSYLEAASNFKDGSYGKSIGQAVGTYIGGPIAGQVGKALGELVDKLFSKGEYVQSTGEAGTSFSSLGMVTGQTSVRNSGGASADSTALKFTQGLNSSYIDTAAKLGIKAAESFFYYGGNNSDGGKFRIGASVGGVGEVFNTGEISAKDGATKLAASRAVFAALQASDLPKYLAGAFDGLVASNLDQAGIDTAINGAQALKNLHDNLLQMPFEQLKDLSFGATKALIEFSGGIDQLGQNLGTFYKNFYSPDEQKGQTIKNINTTLGNAGLQIDVTGLTRESFRALVEAQDLTTESGQKTYAALLSVAGAFAGITPLADAATQATDSLAAAAEKLASTNASLQDRLDLLTGAQTDRSLELRDATDETTRALLRQIFAQEDLNAAAEKFSSVMSGIGSETFDLENQILDLQGNKSEVLRRTRERDLAALTEGLTDPEQIAKITAGYDYNLSLKATIQSLQDATAAQEASSRAAEESARAADQLKSALQSVTDTIFDEVARLRGSLGTPEENLAAAQAKFSITAAQAAAGDQAAYKALPELSRALSTALSEQGTTSLAELSFIQARTAGTLEEIGKKFAAQFGLQIPQFAVGTNYIPQDMLAVVHKGEAIIPAAYNPANGGAQANTARLEALVEVLIARVETLETLLERTADATEDAAGTLDSATEGGNAMRSIVMEPIPA